jgi:dihydroflavonol-4-reductase
VTVAVTGAAGHLGSNLVRALLARDRRVRCLIHENSRGIDGLDVEVVRGDVLDPETLRAAFEGAEVVHHLAGVISIDGDRSGRVSETNIDGARNAAEAALDAGVRRFVHCCSIHAFDQAPLDGPLDETRARASDKRHPAYDRSKAAGEAAVRDVMARGLNGVIVHPSAVLGPHDFAPSRMGQVLIKLANRDFAALVPGGVDWVDVRDVADGMIAAETLGRSGESYLLTGHWHTVRELADMACEMTGVAPPRLTAPFWMAQLGAPFVAGYHRIFGGEPLYTSESLRALRSNHRYTHDKAAQDLGYVPRPLRETLRHTYEWFAEAGMIDCDERRRT